MSLKAKLSLIFSFIVTIILVLNNTLYYFSTRDLLRADQEKQMELIAREIRIAIEHSQYGSKYVEDLIGQQLRTASLVTQYALDPDIEKVSNKQLEELRDKIGISHITLFKQVGDDIKGVKSSDPKETDLSTKDWGYWFQAFQQLLSNRQVTIPEGQKLPNYWSGPIDVSSSDPTQVDKWGYYFDGTTNYIINPYVRDEHIKKFEQLTGPKAILEKTLKDNDVLLEITGFNPKAFGKDPIIKITNGVELIELANRPIFFGDYTFKDLDKDLASVQKAMETGNLINLETTANGKHVIKSFIPVQAEHPYVLGLVTDYKVIQDVLNQQLVNNLIISLLLLIVVFFSSYFLAGYIVNPVYHILQKVNEISKGNLGARVAIHRKDELGMLADRVNTMSHNLQIFTEQLQQKNERIQYQANHDPLTDLPNRRLFNHRLIEELIHAHRHEQQLAVMFFDLDRFKNINDTIGHGMGDLLLQAIAKRVTSCLSDNDIVSRIGGDEFTVLLPNITQVEDATCKAQKILDVLAQPFTLEEREMFITASIGITLYPSDGNDLETLMKNADTAMYYAKEKGGNRYEIYHSSMNATIFERMQLENNLRKAMERDEFQLYYHPKVDLQTGCITGLEALIRWKNPDLGIVSPARFIPLAEETGLIIPIGEWVLRTACAQNKAWQEAGYPPLNVAVNLSARQFQQENFSETVNKVLHETGLDPRFLELEITESIAMQDADHVIVKLRELKKLGIKISIDDFGTGYSSLGYLMKFPIDTLKIDRTFMEDIRGDLENTTITEAIITMAHSLKLNVVAEGVETEAQLNFLTKQQCDEVQGYFFCHPLSAEEFEKKYRDLLENAAGRILNDKDFKMEHSDVTI